MKKAISSEDSFLLCGLVAFSVNLVALESELVALGLPLIAREPILIAHISQLVALNHLLESKQLLLASSIYYQLSEQRYCQAITKYQSKKLHLVFLLQ